MRGAWGCRLLLLVAHSMAEPSSLMSVANLFPKLGYHGTKWPTPTPTPAPVPTPPPRTPLSAVELLNEEHVHARINAIRPHILVEPRTNNEHRQEQLVTTTATERKSQSEYSNMALLTPHGMLAYRKLHTPSPTPRPTQHPTPLSELKGAVFDDDDDGGTESPTPVPPTLSPAPTPQPTLSHIAKLFLDPENALNVFKKINSVAPTPAPTPALPTPRPVPPTPLNVKVFKDPRMPAHIRQYGLVSATEADFSPNGKSDDFALHPLCCGKHIHDDALVQKYCHYKGYRGGVTLGSRFYKNFEFCVSFDGDERLVPDSGCTFSRIRCEGYVWLPPTPSPEITAGLTSDDDDDELRTPAPTPPPTPLPTPLTGAPTMSPTPAQPTVAPTRAPTPQPTPDLNYVLSNSFIKSAVKENTRLFSHAPTPKPTASPTKAPTPQPLYDDDDDRSHLTPTPAFTLRPTPLPTPVPTPEPTTLEDMHAKELGKVTEAMGDCTQQGVTDLLKCEMLKMSKGSVQNVKKPMALHASSVVPPLPPKLRGNVNFGPTPTRTPSPTRAPSPPCLSVFCQLFRRNQHPGDNDSGVF